MHEIASTVIARAAEEGHTLQNIHLHLQINVAVSACGQVMQ